MPSQGSAIRRLALALFVSSTMSEAAWIALAFDVYRRTGSGLWLAGVFLLTLGIPGLLTPIGGAIADRFDRRKVMVIADAGAAAVFCVLIFTQQPSAMLAVAFVAAIVERPFGPALRASVPNLVGPEELTRANSTLALGWKLGVVVGATAGGLLFERYGPAWVFGLNAASFLVSSGLIASIHGSFSAGRGGAVEDDHRGALAGFRFVRRRVTLLALLGAWALLWLGVDIVIVGEPALVEELSGGALGYGLLGTAWGLGSIVGAFIGRRVGRGAEVGAVVLEAVGTAVGLAFVSFASSMTIAVLGMAIVAVFDALGEVAGTTLVQRETPDEVRGRVFAAFSTAGQAGNTVGFVAAGPLLDVVGARGLYRIGAVASGAAAVALTPALRARRLASEEADRPRV